MKLLFTIPHFFGGPRGDESKKDGKYASQVASVETRLEALQASVYALHQTFGASQAMIRHSDRRTVQANSELRHEVHVVLVVMGTSHLLKEADFPAEICQPFSVDDDPMKLGFHCHTILRDRWGNYDYYGYLEDDLILTDSWFFEKLRWFNGHVGDGKLLLPNRFEKSRKLAYKKCYLDGDLSDHVASPFQDISETPELSSTVMGKSIRFARPSNPHSGCFFLNATQMKKWIAMPHFGDRSTDFVGPLESAASLGIMKTFQVYKPAIENASFLEIEHHDERFTSLIRR